MAPPLDWLDDDDVEIHEHPDGSIFVAWPAWPEFVGVTIAANAKNHFPSFRDLRQSIQLLVGVNPEDRHDG